MTQPNALAAITAALTGGKPPVVTPATLPVQSTPFAFTQPTQPAAPQPAAFVAQPSNPFQPSPVQAQAAFVAAVPRAAEQHSHPTTGVPFAPINPPGEAASAPTVGLDAVPVVVVNNVQSAPVQTVAEPEPAPKASRARKPRGKATDAEMLAICGLPSSAGDGAADAAAVSAGLSGDFDLQASSKFPPTPLAVQSTEALVHELSERGWTVSLSK